MRQLRTIPVDHVATVQVKHCLRQITDLMALLSTVKTMARCQRLFSETQYPDQSQDNSSKILIICTSENTQDGQQKYLNLANIRNESRNLTIFSDDNHSKEVGNTPYKAPHQLAKHSNLKIPTWYALFFSKTQPPLPNMTLIQTNSRIQTVHYHLFDTKTVHLNGLCFVRLREMATTHADLGKRLGRL